VNITLFNPRKRRAETGVSFLGRTLLLVGINFVELVVCFGVVYGLNCQYLNHAGQFLTGLYFSAITQLTIGYGDVSPIGWLRIVAPYRASQDPFSSYWFLPVL
jgi:hypothetical protein